MQRLAVQDVIIRYAQLLDTGQTHRVAEEIFTEDAVIDYGAPNPVTGRAAIAAFFAGFSDMLGTSHNLSNFIVDITGDTAHCLSHCMAWHWSKRDGAPIAPADFVAVGGYEGPVASGRRKVAHRASAHAVVRHRPRHWQRAARGDQPHAGHARPAAGAAVSYTLPISPCTSSAANNPLCASTMRGA